jgi:hypothetical protein
MKYLKRFNESDDFDYLKDIEDICLELNDGGKITSKLAITDGTWSNGLYKTYFSFYLNQYNYLKDSFLFSEISEYVFRIKYFLGDKYKGSLVYFAERNPGVSLDLDNESDLYRLENEKISMFVILL